MKLTYRSERNKLEGFWVSPDNHIYKLPDGMSHAEWLMHHQNVVMHYDNNLKPNDPDMFEKAFYKGWVRIRIEFSISNDTQWIASVSALDGDIVSTLPEDIKDVIASASALEFIEMPSGNITTYDKQEMDRLLHRAVYASFVKVRTAMLNPNWKKYPYEKDLKAWHRLLELLEDDYKYAPSELFDVNDKLINRLYNAYVRTNSGAFLNDDRGLIQKMRILSKGPMRDLERAIQADESRHVDDWNEQQLKDESLDARLEREKGEYESRNSSLSLSFRENNKQIN
jgi:hypothetical protein